MEIVLKRADSALYLAKDNGRNRVEYLGGKAAATRRAPKN